MANKCCSLRMRLLRAYVEDSACILGTIEGARENLDRATTSTATPAADLGRDKSYVWRCAVLGGG